MIDRGNIFILYFIFWILALWNNMLLLKYEKLKISDQNTIYELYMNYLNNKQSLLLHQIITINETI